MPRRGTNSNFTKRLIREIRFLADFLKGPRQASPENRDAGSTFRRISAIVGSCRSPADLTSRDFELWLVVLAGVLVPIPRRRSQTDPAKKRTPSGVDPCDRQYLENPIRASSSQSRFPGIWINFSPNTGNQRDRPAEFSRLAGIRICDLTVSLENVSVPIPQPAIAN